jgi:sigma-B regulation protein RsbU (phosphoserine phosphatase)
MLPSMSSTTPISASAPPALAEVLDEFRRAHGTDVHLWRRVREGWDLYASTAPATRDGPGGDAVSVASESGIELRLELADPAEVPSAPELRFLASIVQRLLRHDAETRFFGRELADRYEEITLLYSISEILGAVISLEEAAATILSEVVDTLSVERASLWIHNTDRQRLELIAAVGGNGQTAPIALDDDCSVTAAVFRNRRSVILEPEDEFPRDQCAPEVRRGSFLSVPVSYTPPDGEPRTIGVINLVGRRSADGFSAGDQKLISAIASQIGAAVENSRLVAESLRRERWAREMELAHDLQLKLLPPLAPFEGYAEVAARCVPADSVGGDFYHLFRLPGGRIGVMIGDVSSHGFGAALIMALTISAVGIHASEGDSPAEVLRRTHQALIDELETTEMYLTLFYGVIDPVRGTITYVNAGHSHAFRVTPGGEAVRLAATDLPFGIVDQGTYREDTAPWVGGEDLLVLFTDGLSDALGLGEVDGEAELLRIAAESATAPVASILDRLFALRGGVSDAPADDRTAVLVRI